MAVAAQNVFPVTTSFTTVLTVAAGEVDALAVLHVFNTTDTAITLSVCLVPSAGTAVEANALVWLWEIPSRTPWQLGKGMVFPAQSTLQAKAASTGINIHVSGAHFTTAEVS